MSTPRALVIRTAGINSDTELCRAFELAGASADLVHLDRLMADPQRIAEFDLIGFPGGFSYGDDVASGRIMAMHTRERLLPELKLAAGRGVPMIGICNGFQVLVQIGLLPGFDGPDAAELTPCVAMCENTGGRFIDDCVPLEPNPDSPCIWTRDLVERARSGADEPELVMTIGHGEGRLVTRDSATLQRLRENNQIALRYTRDINGSADRIAGICDPTGRIFGLMPHPERGLDWKRHPYWTRLSAEVRRTHSPGLGIFISAVEAVATQTA
ncbi:MAG: phosphoribosylformylglycinamidine synthase subunit PurQ [Phycisphaerales bacterium]